MTSPHDNRPITARLKAAVDGNNVATVGLWKAGGFSTGNEENDLWFRNVLTGIYFDGSSQGQAEQLVMRCRFDRCANGGGLSPARQLRSAIGGLVGLPP